MGMMVQDWAIAMTVREPAPLVLANVAWHLATGTSAVFVYLDDPDDPVAAPLAAIPGAVVIPCTEAHWKTLAPAGRRPESINRRQSLNANDALARCGTDWLFHIDADEFLLQHRPLGEELAVVAETGSELHLPVAERIFVTNAPRETIFDGIFRTSTKGLNRRADGSTNDTVIFGDHMPVLLHGVLGHSAGKCGVPVGGGLRIGIHWAYKGETRDRAERYRSTSTRLLHFDGLTRLHWLSKLVRYEAVTPDIMGIADHRKAQIELYQGMRQSPGGLVELHAELREFDQDRLQRLRAFGLLHEQAFDPRATIAPLLGTLPDLSVEGFDARLLSANPGLASLVQDCARG